MRKNFLILSITAMAVMVPANAQQQNSLIGLNNQIGSQLSDDNPYVFYDDNPLRAWSELNSLSSGSIQYKDRFYGQDIVIELESDEGKQFVCLTPNPTLFWESLLIRSKGESIKCVLQQDYEQN